MLTDKEQKNRGNQMSEKKNILILCGGGGTEHEVSIVSSKYIFENIQKSKYFNPILVEITKEGHWEQAGRKCSLNGRILKTPTEQPYIDYAIPCIHGPPGETGEIQSFFKIIGLPYFGPDTESSVHCFNKATTKLWLDMLEIPNTPWLNFNINQNIDEKKLLSFFDENNSDVFIKATNQGSSVGCYHVTKKEEVLVTVKKAFKFANNVLIEKTIKARELEISVFEYNGEIHASNPGEIVCPGGFYDYEEKYSKTSKTTTHLRAQGLSEQIINEMREAALKVFKALGLRHLSRIDFFYFDNQFYLNEINTFPGMTPISMFPQMLEGYGIKFFDYLETNIRSDLGI